ncbi:hypothetical protein KQI69_00120 [Eubacterium sp. MSJ-13]|uniref:glycosyltransferase family 10 domain-containing protein n=1 Tax=Eubacterium sp. MSJ-13 TaxID=2841513 RepID=UPI001C11A20C|nr:glycosyltransferase family 10 [Eubacterium sp. MSJ-13]MBU5477609.1 hypothetical protein [Eubacterium sp. MSJ-13]
MKEINICVLHPEIKNENDVKRMFDFCFEDEINFIWNEVNPDYIIATEVIYYQDKYYQKFKKLFNDDVITIFSTGESISPDMNLFDYAIVFDRHLEYGDRICRIPTLLRYRNIIFEDLASEAESSLNKKEKFCNFIYSNPNAPKERDGLFYKLSEYKKVDSLGPHLNNMGNKTSRNIPKWARQSVIDRLPYKFSIAAENCCFSGNVTEKLLCCLQARTVPIYWGDPSIKEEFNEKAFINCNDYTKIEDLIRRVMELDSSDELWRAVVCQPWQTNAQKIKSELEEKKYKNFIRNIFLQSKLQAKRKGRGYHPDLYRTRFFNESGEIFVSKREEKLKVYYQLLLKWVRKNLNGGIGDICDKLEIKNVSIYGIGEVGKLLVDEFEKNGIHCEDLIDQSCEEYNGRKVISLSEKLKKVDAIIVTLPFAFENIKKKIEDKGDYKVISIEELF